MKVLFLLLLFGIASLTTSEVYAYSHNIPSVSVFINLSSYVFEDSILVEGFIENLSKYEQDVTIQIVVLNEYLINSS